MTNFDNNIFENIRTRATYEDVRRLIPDKHVPKAMKRNTACPFCNSTDGFGWFNVDGQVLSHCFACEGSGDLVKVFSVINSLENIDAAKHIADTLGINYSDESKTRKSYNFKVDRIKTKSDIDINNPIILDYKERKKIDLTRISKYICLKNDEYGVPIKSSNGMVQGMQRLKKMVVGGSKMKGGMFYDKLSVQEPLYVVEGASDYLTLKYIGIDNVIGLPSANFNEDIIVSFLSRFRNITVILDADKKAKEQKSEPSFTGMKAAKKLKNAMGRTIKVKFIDDGDGEDISDAYVAKVFKGKYAFERYVSDLPEFSADQMMRMMGGAQKLTDVVIAEDMVEQTSVIIINGDL